MDSKNILTTYHSFTTYHIFAPKIQRPIFLNFSGRGQPLFSNFHSIIIIKKDAAVPGGGREHFWNSPKPRMLFFLFLNIKMPTIVGILTFMTRKNFMLS